MTTPHVCRMEFSHVFLFKRKASNSEERGKISDCNKMAPFIIVQLCFCLLLNWEKGMSWILGDWRSHSCPISCGCVTPTRITLPYLVRNTINVDRTSISKYTMKLYFKRGKHTYVKWFCRHTCRLSYFTNKHFFL